MAEKKIPIPVGDYSLNTRAVKKYLEALCPETVQGRMDAEEAKMILDHTKYISFDEFLRELKKVIQTKLLPLLKNRNWTLGYPLAAVDDKSNYWVFRLVMREFPQLKKTYVPTAPIPAQTKVVQFVLLDDAIYSGTQMIAHIRNLVRSLQERRSLVRKPVDIYVVSPYSTRRLENLLSTETFPSWITIHILYTTELVSFHDILQREAYQKAEDEFEAKMKKHQPGEEEPEMDFTYTVPRLHNYSELSVPVYFGHKLPDELSSFTKLYAGLVPPWRDTTSEKDRKQCPRRNHQQYVPLIKNCNDFKTALYCPRPPYLKKFKD